MKAGDWEIQRGDCLDYLPLLEANSIDAVVTDPPYGLGFMGKDWDHGVPGERFWRQVIRVLKPGGVLLAFGGTRTFHRLAVGIEDAGFEMRDCLSWIYGTGFPKSLNVGKAIDRQRGDDIRPVCRWLRAHIDESGILVRELAEHFGFNSRMIDHWAARDTDSQPTLPTPGQWEQLREVLKFGDEMDEAVARFNDRKGEVGDDFKARPVVGAGSGGIAGAFDHKAQTWTAPEDRERDVFDLTEPQTEQARRWEGHGTALKPAWEPILLAMKPAEGTFADNALKWGVAGLWIDGARIGTDIIRNTNHAGDKLAGFKGDQQGQLLPYTDHAGRFPTNILLDEESSIGLDAQAGERVSGSREAGAYSSAGVDVFGDYAGNQREAIEGSSGGASRFFYCVKAGRAERDFGLGDEFPKAPLNWSSGDQSPGTFQADGTDRMARNPHPTVKPADLMRYLVRLVRMPERGTILDPFAGSGSTGIAAVLEGFSFIGIEKDGSSADIARQRIAAAADRFGKDPGQDWADVVSRESSKLAKVASRREGNHSLFDYGPAPPSVSGGDSDG